MPFKDENLFGEMYHQVTLSLWEHQSVPTQIYMGNPAIHVGYVVCTIMHTAITDEISSKYDFIASVSEVHIIYNNFQQSDYLSLTLALLKILYFSGA